jgi:hypothetical protein
MKAKTFFDTIANRRSDILQIFLDILKKTSADYCVVGGLAVNAYVEPVVSLDLDVVVNVQELEKVWREAIKIGFRAEKFKHSVNLTRSGSDLRIQLQTDARYQDFIARAKPKKILGYTMKVAALEDVLLGKSWAYLDEERRRSKRQKDLADIIRLLEAYPELEDKVATAIRTKLQ